jgi:chromosome segregation ATPase
MRVQAINREARTFNRKLQTAIADRSHAVGYEINLLQETLKSSKFDKNERQKAIRRRLREEYSPQVREMTLQLFTLKHNLEQYQKNLQHEIEGNMFEVKKQSISQLLQSQNLPEEVKDSMKQAFDFDDALHELMERKSELSSTVFKLKAMRLLQDFSVRSDFQVRLKKIEEQREMVKQENNEFSRERDVKEAALKQQYTTVMQSVRAAEKEVEKLRRELDQENRNRNKLREWRAKHEKRVALLEKKLKRLTEWSKYKPDKLIFELNQIEAEIERRQRAKERGPALLESTKETVDRELQRCQQQLQAHEAMRDELARVAVESEAKHNLAASVEDPDGQMIEIMEENQRLKEENEGLQQRLAELSLQIAAVSQITVGGESGEGGVKVKASRLDGLC